MNVLVVYCHPCPESFTAAVRDTVLATLAARGHSVRLIDLHAAGFDPVMGAEERRRYHDESGNTAPVREHVAALQWAEGLIFVYPTWWFGLPAMLKGWLDRVLVPGFAFAMPTATQEPRPLLTNVRALGVYTTCGATRLTTWLIGSPGRRTLLRGLRSCCHPLARTSFAALYRFDSAPPETRRAHLATVAHRVVTLTGPAASRRGRVADVPQERALSETGFRDRLL